MAFIPKVVAVNTTESPSATDKITAGVDLLANAVKQTLGPFGRNFLLEKGLKVTNDGLNIAKEIQHKDEISDLGVRVARQALEKTNDVAGDGTTTAITLFQAIYAAALRLLPGKNRIKGKMSAMQLKKQLSEECKEVIAKLEKLATPVESKEALIEVAKVSVEDQELAELIGTAQWEVGKDGVLVAENSNDPKSSVEKILGIRFDNGFGTSMIINDVEKNRLDKTDVAVLMMNYTIESIAQVKPTLDKLAADGRMAIAIIARAFSSTAIKECMENCRNGLNIYPINAPYVNQPEIMRDLAAVLGGRYFDTEQSELSDMTVQDVGYAERVLCERFSAIFIGKKNEQSETRIAERVKILEKAIEGEPSIFHKKALQARLAQLTKGFALVKVGSLTDDDRKRKYDKVEDAVNAVRAALQEGTVRGAGLAFKEISEGMSEESILKRPLLAPYEQIMANAGAPFEVEEWVRNPLKVDRVALLNACEIAANLATAGGAIAQERQKPRYMQVKDEESVEVN